MQCNETYELIQDFVDGRLNSREREGLTAHVASCAGCAAQLEEYRVLATMLDEHMTPEPVPPGFADGVIATLKAAGRIAEARVHRRRVFAWVPTPLRVPVAAVVMALIAIAVFPATVGLLEVAVGKGTVLVTDTYIEIQEKATDVGVFTKFVVNLQKNLHMLKTVVLAAVSLIARAGEMFMIPALALIIALTTGVVLFVRSQRRSAHHASFSF